MKTTRIEKTNLMIFITPYIIKNEGEAEDITRKKGEGLEEFRRQYGIEKKSTQPTMLTTPAGQGEATATSGPVGTLTVTAPEVRSRPAGSAPEAADGTHRHACRPRNPDGPLRPPGLSPTCSRRHDRHSRPVRADGNRSGRSGGSAVRRLIGEILVESGLSPERLKKALDLQKKRGGAHRHAPRTP